MLRRPVQVEPDDALSASVEQPLQLRSRGRAFLGSYPGVDRCFYVEGEAKPQLVKDDYEALWLTLSHSLPLHMQASASTTRISLVVRSSSP